MYTSNHNSNLRLLVLAGAILSASLLSSNALAQTIASAASAGATETGLSEITITAQRYEATIQDTPVSISARVVAAITS